MRDTDELIQNPSRISRHLAAIVSRLNKEAEEKFCGGWLSKLKSLFSVNLYIKDSWKNYYKYINEYKVPKTEGSCTERLKSLFLEFENMYRKLIFNNFALIYMYTKKENVVCPILTMEDKKMLFLGKFHNNEITQGLFNRNFGHYALNAFELSSKRFEEYSEKELRKVAKFAANLNISKQMELETFIHNHPKDMAPVLIALRELSKYKILCVVRDLRYTLLQMAKERKIKDIFSKSFQQLAELPKQKAKIRREFGKITRFIKQK
jgi:hypothetical protein